MEFRMTRYSLLLMFAMGCIDTTDLADLIKDNTEETDLEDLETDDFEVAIGIADGNNIEEDEEIYHDSILGCKLTYKGDDIDEISDQFNIDVEYEWDVSLDSDSDTVWEETLSASESNNFRKDADVFS